MKGTKMKGYLRGLVCSVCIIFFISGCGTTTTSYNTLQEKEWLTKAYRYDKNGWIYLHIEGKPFERGFQRGYLTANEIDECFKTTEYVEEFETAKELGFFTKAATKLFKGKIPKEYIEEMKGMVRGMQKAGKEITYEQMLLMNGSIDILWYWWPEEKESMGAGCSAFIAAGDVTADGGIVMAHNTWSGYVDGQFCNIIVDIVPDNGHRILMQSWGPLIYSGTDFFITSAGLVGTETTIGDFSGFNKKGTPVFVRARKAMQYANNIDEWAEIMIKNNSGAYANSWLLGDIKTNEIARLELGLKHHSLEKNKNGYFAGSNITDNIKILREETKANHGDVRRTYVARRERWKQLMKKHHGRISTEIAKQMLADHYDVYLGKENPSSRTICGHLELDDGSIPTSNSAYSPSGAFDGKVVDSKMAKDWKIMAKWGSSCDIGFDSQKFLERHTQYDWLEGYLKDLPAGSWTVFPCTAAGE
jgi:hypothetical protein